MSAFRAAGLGAGGRGGPGAGAGAGQGRTRGGRVGAGEEGCTFYSSLTIWRSIERRAWKSGSFVTARQIGAAHLHLISYAGGQRDIRRRRRESPSPSGARGTPAGSAPDSQPGAQLPPSTRSGTPGVDLDGIGWVPGKDSGPGRCRDRRPRVSRPGRSCSHRPDYRLARGISRPQLDKRTREEPWLVGNRAEYLDAFSPLFLLSFFFFPLPTSLRQTRSRRPLPTCALEERGENRKLPR